MWRRLAAASSDSPSLEAPTFAALLELIGFLTFLWGAGQASNLLRTAPLVGEIVAGAILGPPFLDAQRHLSALVLFGELGLILQIVEAGLFVKLSSLRLVGLRGLAVALVSSLLVPAPICLGICRAFHLSYPESLAVAACLVPSSGTVALRVLRRARLLHTPNGQLVASSIAIADLVAIIIIGELRALEVVNVANILEPLYAFFFALVIGVVAFFVLPRVLTRVCTLCSTIGVASW